MSPNCPTIQRIFMKRFESLLSGVNAPIVIFHGPNHVYEMVTEAYQHFYPDRELLGKEFLDAQPQLKNTVLPQILKQVYETGETVVTQEVLVKIFNHESNELEERYFDTSFSRVDCGDGEVFRIIATPRDVTDRVLLRKQLESSLSELKKERATRELFFSSLTHDLRTPLTIVKHGAKILKKRPEDTEAVKNMAERFLLCVDKADHMICDFLDANRLKAGKKLPLSLARCRMDEILENTLKDLELMHGKRFKIIYSTNDFEGCWDYLAVQRMVDNLASNAIKYGAPQSEITISLDANSDWVEIGVHNEGNPISDDEQRLLFKEYNRSKFAVEHGQKGWGIGLMLVQGLAHAHGGAVRFISNENEGTTFFIHLPRGIPLRII